MSESSIETDGPLTIPAARAAARKHKVVRKSAKGRKLMRWGPDEDQQLLLATEAVVIEGSVELDWNLVGLKLKHQVTGEAIKQHLCKVRAARESAGMQTPAKAEGRSAFGTRRGVTRHPPVDPNLGPKSKSEVVEDESEWEEKPTLSKGIKNRGLLYGPAIPKAEQSASPSPAPVDSSPSMEKESSMKRKFKAGSGEESLLAHEPLKKRSRRGKVKKSKEFVVDDEPKAEQAGKSTFRRRNFESEEFHTRLTRAGVTNLAAATEQEAKSLLVEKAIKPTPAPKKRSQPKPEKIVRSAETPAISERSLRNKSKRTGSFDIMQAPLEESQFEASEEEPDVNNLSYEPETTDTVVNTQPQMSSRPAVVPYETTGTVAIVKDGSYEFEMELPDIATDPQFRSPSLTEAGAQFDVKYRLNGPEERDTAVNSQTQTPSLSEVPQDDRTGTEFNFQYQPEPANTSFGSQNTVPFPDFNLNWPSNLAQDAHGGLMDSFPLPANPYQQQPAPTYTGPSAHQRTGLRYPMPAKFPSSFDVDASVPSGELNVFPLRIFLNQALGHTGLGVDQRTGPRYPMPADFTSDFDINDFVPSTHKYYGD